MERNSENLEKSSNKVESSDTYDKSLTLTGGKSSDGFDKRGSIEYRRENINLTKRKSVTGIEIFELLKNEDFDMNNLRSGAYTSLNRSKTHIYKRSLSLNNVERLIQREMENANNQGEIQTSEFDLQGDNVIEMNLEPNDFRESYSTNVVDNLIDKKLREMKDKMLEKIEGYKNTFEEKYEDHIQRIKRSVIQKARRIKQVFNNNFKHGESNSSTTPTNSPEKEFEYMKKYTSKNVGAKLDNIFDIHDKIESSIDKNFEILHNFLNHFDIFQDNPLENFINENADDIVNSWIFSKINFEKINLINLLENDKIPNNLKNFIFQDTVNKFSIISVKRGKNYDFEKKLMYDNHLILEKLCFKNLDYGEFHKIFSQISAIEGIKFQKLTEISLLECTMDSVTFGVLFPNTQKIKMKKCKIRMRFDNLSTNFSNLKILSIRKSNFNNSNLSSLIEDLSNCKQILENLECLDLSFNKISQFDLTPLSNNSTKMFALQVLVLNNNKLYKFKSQNLTLLPSLRLLNLSSNNFTTGKDFIELKERAKKNGLCIFISISKNLFMLNDQNQNKKYVDYLVENLPEFQFFLRKLDLSFVFNSYNNISLYKLYLNSNIQISLKKLNLSYSSLDSNTLITLIKNNNGFINLRHLNISNNFIDDVFLDAYISENFIHLLENLEYINFSFNQISQNSLSNLENILKNQKKMTKIKLNGNPVEYSLVEYFSKSENEDCYMTLGEFVENLADVKKEFRIILSKKAESSISHNTVNSGSSFTSKKSKEMNRIVIFE